MSVAVRLVHERSQDFPFFTLIPEKSLASGQVYAEDGWRLTALAFLYTDDGRVALVSKHRPENKKPHRFDFIKGRVHTETKESIVEALFRECVEEGCIHTIDDLRFMGLIYVPADKVNNGRDGYVYGKKCACFTGRLSKESLAQACEIYEPNAEDGIVALWLVSFAEAKRLLQSQRRKQIVFEELYRHFMRML